MRKGPIACADDYKRERSIHADSLFRVTPDIVRERDARYVDGQEVTTDEDLAVRKDMVRTKGSLAQAREEIISEARLLEYKEIDNQSLKRLRESYNKQLSENLEATFAIQCQIAAKQRPARRHRLARALDRTWAGLPVERQTTKLVERLSEVLPDDLDPVTRMFIEVAKEDHQENANRALNAIADVSWVHEVNDALSMVVPKNGNGGPS